MGLSHALPQASISNGLNTWNNISQFRGGRPAALASGPTKVNPMALLGAAAVQQQHQQMQNAGLLTVTHGPEEANHSVRR